MALYYDLPVFKDVYKLILKIFEYTQGFPREYKYTLGQDMKRDGIVLVRSMTYPVNSRHGRFMQPPFSDNISQQILTEQHCLLPNEVFNPLCPSTFTRHIRQEPVGSICSIQQRLGMSKPFCFATLSRFSLFSASISLPSIVK